MSFLGLGQHCKGNTQLEHTSNKTRTGTPFSSGSATSPPSFFLLKVKAVATTNITNRPDAAAPLPQDQITQVSSSPSSIDNWTEYEIFLPREFPPKVQM